MVFYQYHTISSTNMLDKMLDQKKLHIFSQFHYLMTHYREDMVISLCHSEPKYNQNEVKLPEAIK